MRFLLLFSFFCVLCVSCRKQIEPTGNSENVIPNAAIELRGTTGATSSEYRTYTGALEVRSDLQNNFVVYLKNLNTNAAELYFAQIDRSVNTTQIVDENFTGTFTLDSTGTQIEVVKNSNVEYSFTLSSNGIYGIQYLRLPNDSIYNINSFTLEEDGGSYTLVNDPNFESDEDGEIYRCVCRPMGVEEDDDCIHGGEGSTECSLEISAGVTVANASTKCSTKCSMVHGYYACCFEDNSFDGG